MTIKRLAAAGFLWCGAFAATVAGAQTPRPCIPAREAEALFLTMAPQLLTATATACAATLPASAYLRRPAERLTVKYAAASDAAWPAAKDALRKLIGANEASAMLDGELIRPMLTSMIAPMLTKEVKPRDCPAIDRILGLLDPLPARSTASLIVTIVELSARDKATRAGRSGFMICPSAAP